MYKKGFTLVEVLITLAIIGVVAAITLPPLMQNYRKHVVETRLKSFYSTMNQAIIQSELVNGDKVNWEFPYNNGGYTKNGLDNFYNTYFKDYLKISEKKFIKVRNNYYILIYFNNGSAAKIGYAGVDWNFYPYAKNVEKTDVVLGRDIFMFGFYTNVYKYISNICTQYPIWCKYFVGKGMEPYIKIQWTGKYADLKDNYGYAKIIQLNGWKIPKDYPFRF